MFVALFLKHNYLIRFGRPFPLYGRFDSNNSSGRPSKLSMDNTNRSPEVKTSPRYRRRRMGKSHSNQSITRHAVNKFDSKLGVDGRACDLSGRRTFGPRAEENFISIPTPSWLFNHTPFDASIILLLAWMLTGIPGCQPKKALQSKSTSVDVWTVHLSRFKRIFRSVPPWCWPSLRSKFYKASAKYQ